MMTGARRHTLIAGVSLILAVNAIALGGVAYNRSGEPECTVKLSERELQLPYHYGGWNNMENSGVELNLRWRVHAGNDDYDNYYGYGSYGGTPDWLDKAKLAALGFDVSQVQSRATRNFKRAQMKEVLLVLELNGPAYRKALARAQKKASDEEALKAANSGNKEFERRAKNSSEYAQREERENSRLFVIDAGLDASVLRVQYPDKAQFLIVKGQVRPQVVTRDKQEKLSGTVSAISISQNNVPVEFQSALKHTVRNDKRVPFDATVAFGKRLEPWIVALNGN